MRIHISVLFTVACAACCSLALGAEKPDKPKILIVAHAPDHPVGEHEYLGDAKVLAKCIEQNGATAVISDGWPEASRLEGIQGLVIHVREGGTMLYKNRETAEKVLARGVGLTVLHWGTGASEEAGSWWTRTLGGWFRKPPEISKYIVEQTTIRCVQEGHPIGNGWEPIEIKDEWYVKLLMAPESEPLIVGRVSGEEYPLGWTFERPGSNGGRSFGFVGLHFHDALKNEAYRRMIVNGILWSARVDVPESGAKVEITEDDLKLPPREEKKKAAASKTGVHAFTVKDIDGADKSLADYAGKVLLIVNVASKCGYTKQYTGLQKLYEEYKDKGLVVLGVPSNDFRGQEPGTEQEIKQFCSTVYNVTFPLTSKVSVKNGPDQTPLYQYLTQKEKNGAFDATVSWNFNKFLVGKDGRPIKHYESKVTPEDETLRRDIEAALK
jgi:glutathione peroxidase